MSCELLNRSRILESLHRQRMDFVTQGRHPIAISEERIKMIISDVDFPEPLVRSLQAGELVVFAGAGVSMGPPANLPDFGRLADQVADGTVHVKGPNETEDLFLNRLQVEGVLVHARAAQLLEQADPMPTPLHQGLLGLYANPGNIRIVTTNFDRLFEQAAGDPGPMVFDAPALPLGSGFQGIVHVHGSTKKPGEMVLTRKDFGHAYLTESGGWARRFLVDLFSSHTVLFVGYSHSDTIMTYLTPSLTRYEDHFRYALISGATDCPDRWHRLGIRPITFPQRHEGDFSALVEAVEGLAKFTRSPVFELRRKVAGIADALPPVDSETSDMIDHALNDPVLAREFVREASLPDWIDWMEQRGHLDDLFKDGELGEKGATLARWLAVRFAKTDGQRLLQLIGRRGESVNPMLWEQIAWALGKDAPGNLDQKSLCRWVHFLTSCIPGNVSTVPLSITVPLSYVAQHCVDLEDLDSLLLLYDAFTARRPLGQPKYGWDYTRAGHDQLISLHRDFLKPNLSKLGKPLLERSVQRLWERHSLLTAWGNANDGYDQDSFRRSAIEPHEQDNHPFDLDALVDIVRDCLEWLASGDPPYVGRWCEYHVDSSAPLLRRLSIHTVSERQDLSADVKIEWLVEHCVVNDNAVRHETFRLAAGAYPHSSPESRLALIEGITAFRSPLEDPEGRELTEAYHRYEWLEWLSRADRDCEFLRRSLEETKDQHPDFSPREHPDLVFSAGRMQRVVGTPSSWTAQQLLSMPFDEWLPVALDGSTTEDSLRPRDQLIDCVAEAASLDPEWGIRLASRMTGNAAWDTRLWRGVLEGWCSAAMDGNVLAGVLEVLSDESLFSEHGTQIAGALRSLSVKHHGLLDEGSWKVAHEIARKLWPYVSSLGNRVSDHDWYSHAINHPAGALAQFWVQSIDAWRSVQDPKPAAFTEEYQAALAEMVDDGGWGSTLARIVLMSRLSFLAFVDENWVSQKLMPLLTPGKDDFVPAWEGLTHCSRIAPGTADLLAQPFLKAIELVDSDFSDALKNRFIDRYIVLFTWFVSGPTDEWITKLFKHGDSGVRLQFVLKIGHILGSLEQTELSQWWATWMKGYWENRLVGVPAKLDETEIVNMIVWAFQMGELFPQAVELAARMPSVPSNRALVFMSFDKSDKVLSSYPCDAAKLLIFLGSSDSEPWLSGRVKSRVAELLRLDLPYEINKGLLETAARHGLSLPESRSD